MKATRCVRGGGLHRVAEGEGACAERIEAGPKTQAAAAEVPVLVVLRSKVPGATSLPREC